MQKTMQANAASQSSMTLKVLSAAMLSVVFLSQACAAGLGKLTVLSGLGQPLRAEIELTAVSAEEVQSLQPKLASVTAFRQANIEFSPTLQSLRFAVEQRGTRQFIRVTSTQPITEPFVDVLLELNSTNGSLLREYTFLLDPPELRVLQPAQTLMPPASVVPQTAQSLPAVASNPVNVTPSDKRSASTGSGELSQQIAKPDSSAPRQRSAAINTGGGRNTPDKQYRVQNGDSLSKIANRNRSQGVSLDQMLVALYRSNPEAFINNNMNRLKAGEIIAIPSAAASASIDALDAQGIVFAQAADFNDYRDKLASQVSIGAARQAGESRQSASGKITARVQENPTPANESLDKLKLSKPTTDTTAKNTAAQEEKIAQEKAAADADLRLKDLERNVGDLQKMLEVKSRDLAARQKAAETLSASAALSSLGATDKATPATAVQPKPVDPLPANGLPAVSAETETPVNAAPVKPATPAIPASALVAVVVPKVPPAALAAGETGGSGNVLSNPLIQGAAVLSLLLGALALLRLRRKKPAKEFLHTSMAETTLKTNSLFGSAGGQTVDTNNSVFDASFDSGPENLDSNEVDPVAEADVYIAYGRDAQAEEILKEALRTHPERHAVRLKLLEIYSGRKDVKAFAAVATELQKSTKGQGQDWKQAVALGIALDPANALYLDGGVASIVPTVSTVLMLPDEKDIASKLLVDSPVISNQSDSTKTVPEILSAAQIPADDNSDLSLKNLDFSDSGKMPALLPALASATKPVTDLAIDPDADVTTKPVSIVASEDMTDSTSTPGAIPEATPVATPLNEALLAGLNFDFLDSSLTKNISSDIQSDTSSDIRSNVAPLVPVSPVSDKNIEKTSELIELDDFNFDLDAPDPQAPQKMQSASAESDPDPLEFDLSGISLDLPEITDRESSIDAVAMPTPTDDVDDTAKTAVEQEAHQEDLSTLDLNMISSDKDAASIGIGNFAEMATKLDLAVAYQEIGDQEGARELLDEVLEGGNSEQSEQARMLLARLA